MKNIKEKYFLTFMISKSIWLVFLLFSILFSIPEHRLSQAQNDSSLAVSALAEQSSVSLLVAGNEETEEQEYSLVGVVNNFEIEYIYGISIEREEFKKLSHERRQLNLVFFNLPPPELHSI
ncbi:MAG: hypothetical protein R2757_10280 [Draconibacterium sp.]